jgi:aerobic-type carbon monoxide dehydrogenase small subunit (CoxS/CutS family)
MILSTKALLNENPNPSDLEAREYLSGNLCRCGSYEQILAAVRRAAQALSTHSLSVQALSAQAPRENHERT